MSKPEGWMEGWLRAASRVYDHSSSCSTTPQRTAGRQQCGHHCRHHPNQTVTVASANLAVWSSSSSNLSSKYFGATPSEVVTPLAAIRSALPRASVTWGGDAKALVWTAATEAADVERCKAAVRGTLMRGWGEGDQRVSGLPGSAACGCGGPAELDV